MWLSIEKALVKSSAIYPYIENLNKSIIIQAGQNCFVKENVFGTEPIRKKVNFVYGRKFTVSKYNFKLFAFFIPKVQLTACRNTAREWGAFGWAPIDTSNNVRLYYTTFTALGFSKNGNGIKLEDFEDNHFFLVFDLTSTEEASRSLTLFPELTGSSLTLNLYFSIALEDAIELFLIGERFSQVFIDSARNISKNTLIDG